MRYISTRGGIEPVGFLDTVTMGLADDGGLILPECVPDVSGKLDAWRDLSYQALAVEVFKIYTDLPVKDIDDLVRQSYCAFRNSEIAPVRECGKIHLLELFHGPTLAFKDVALQLLGNIFEYRLSMTGGQMNIVAATSGDTGSAAIHGVRGKKGLSIFIMFPDGRVSDIQEKQMTSVFDESVHNLAVKGTFDDCQAILKAIFGNLEMKRSCSLGSVNSINWARLMAQIVYYFYSAFRVMERTGAEKVRFSVPTGNFGDIFAGYLAAKMGLPVGRLILATNENDILSRFFNTGVYRRGEVHPTLSPSMDIQVASNFERYLYYLVGENPVCVRNMMESFAQNGVIDLNKEEPVDPLFSAGSGSVADTLRVMREWHGAYDVILDPHSAVGVHCAMKHLSDREPMICLATAHPAKFPGAVEQALGSPLATHPVIDKLKDLPTRSTTLPADVEAVSEHIKTIVEADSAAGK